MVEQAPEDIEIVLVDPALSDDEKASMCRDVDAIISMDVSLDVLRRSPNVKLIQTLSAGYDRLDLAAILEMGIPVANNGGANAIAVSEHTIAMMISLSGRLWHQYDFTMKQRVWKGVWTVQSRGDNRQDGRHRWTGPRRQTGGQAA